MQTVFIYVSETWEVKDEAFLPFEILLIYISNKIAVRLKKLEYRCTYTIVVCML